MWVLVVVGLGVLLTDGVELGIVVGENNVFSFVICWEEAVDAVGCEFFVGDDVVK